ncbi:adenylate/guanylate cyclase domain-containing protein [Salinispira pacifica]|uniref:Adenylate cyclase n=1 Tax=Salinispira pacifica TaxID=1307761 RepID=V5WDB3_9SPIO|nr:adenylate/guanylate cyclase domain-containing protein [Salinispira pacifica]AHC13534.1 Adenylate cyclase [Salinispira pacifica]
MNPKEYRLAAIMFTDIVGFSRMMEKNEKETLELLEYHNEIVRKHTEDLRGSIIKTIGDAFLIDFPNTVNAVNCAIRIQQDLETRNRENPDFTIILRIGVHLGDIYFYENDALGEGINIASRLQSICNPGRICISQDVFNLVNNKIDEIPIKELGAVKLKNISREIRAYEIATNGDARPKSETGKDAASQGTGAGETGAPEQAVSQAGEEHPRKPAAFRENAPAETPSIGEKEVKDLVMAQIKQAGRRLTVDEVRTNLGYSGRKIDDMLDSMVRKGFLAKSTGSQPASPGNRPGSAAGSGTSPYESPDPSEFPYNLRRAAGEFGRAGREMAHELGREFERGRGRSRQEPMGREYPDSSYGRRHGVVIPEGRGSSEDEKRDRELEQAWDRVLDTPYDSWQDQQLIQEYRAQTNKSLKKMESEFRGHLGSYLSVNGGLIAIWAFTGAAFPWFFFPAGGWGIGLLTHWSGLRRKRQEARELQALPALNKQQLKKLRKLHRNRNKFGGHLMSTLATSLFLAGINIITSPMVPWSLIPIAAMSIGVFSHLPAAKHREKETLEELAALNVPVSQLKNAKRLKLSHESQIATSFQSPMEAEAENLKAAVLAQISGMKDRSHLGEDFEQVLEGYVSQVVELSRKDQEINKTLEAIPMTNLEGELLDLQKQHEATGNPDLKVELEKSIESVKKQQNSYYELEKQQQMLKAKLSSAINSLRQLQLDLVRMRRTPELQELPPVDALRNQTGEINHYLSDLEREYRMLEEKEKELNG